MNILFVSLSAVLFLRMFNCETHWPIVGPKEANNTQWKNKDGLFSIYAYMWSSAILLYLLHLFVSLSDLVFTSQNFLGQMCRDDKIDLDSMLNIIHVLDNGFLSEEVEDSDRVSDQTTEMKKSVFTLDKFDFLLASLWKLGFSFDFFLGKLYLIVSGKAVHLGWLKCHFPSAPSSPSYLRGEQHKME